MEDFTNTRRLSAIYGALVNKRHGIITSLIEEPENSDARGLFIFNGITVEASYFRENRHALQQEARNGSGAAFDRSSALWATIGESLERYSAFLYSPEETILASAKQMGNTALSLDRYILFSEEQYLEEDFPFYRPDTDLPRYWVAAKDLSNDGNDCYVPCNMVFLGMKLSSIKENIAQNVSTGLSCSTNYRDAVRGGLCEVIERDAFSAMWQLGFAPPKLVITETTALNLLPNVRTALQSRSTKIHLWWISTDTGIPVVMAMADNQNDGLMAFGTCANPNLERAIDKAVIEALHGLVWSQRVRKRGLPMPSREEIKNPTDHFSYYLEPSRRPELDFLFSSSETIRSCDKKTVVDPTLEQMIQHLKEMGHPTLAVDVTSEDVRHLGLQVIRVLVPGLHPLLFGSDIRSLDTRRLRVIAKNWGISNFPPPNQSPHPFP